MNVTGELEKKNAVSNFIKRPHNNNYAQLVMHSRYLRQFVQYFLTTSAKYTVFHSPEYYIAYFNTILNTELY